MSDISGFSAQFAVKAIVPPENIMQSERASAMILFIFIDIPPYSFV